MEKYKRQEVSPVEEENERDETYEASNPQIDCKRTGENYHIVKPEKNYIEFINDRLSTLTLSRKLRSDAIYMNSFVLGSDREFFDNLTLQEQRQFFYDCTNFFADKYGRENIISAVVHVDETTPHLHLNIVPIVNGKLCSKDLFDKKKLSILQTEFHEVVGKKYSLQRGKEGSTAKHLSTAELKAKTIIENAEKRGNEIVEQKQAELNKLTQAITQATDKPIPKRKNEIEKEITALRAKTVMQEREIKIRGRDQEELFKQLQEAKTADSRKETAFKIVKDMISAYPDEFNELLNKSRDKRAGISHTPLRKNNNDWSK
ncbi:MAG: plasmid recombination protein [Clostridia bacterium]|nr:plasmid recombination protein [Clostridia bacterium]